VLEFSVSQKVSIFIAFPENKANPLSDEFEVSICISVHGPENLGAESEPGRLQREAARRAVHRVQDLSTGAPQRRKSNKTNFALNIR